MTFDSPKAQGRTGFLAKAGDVKLRDVTIRSDNEHASIAVVSMDERPLAQSGRILVQIGTSVRPTGWKQEAEDFPGDDGKTIYHGYKITSTGTMPWRVSNADVTLEVRNAAPEEGDAARHLRLLGPARRGPQRRRFVHDQAPRRHAIPRSGVTQVNPLAAGTGAGMVLPR